MSCTANIRVEPVNVSWGGEDLGKLDGDIEVSLEEQGVEITAHQDGTNVLDMIRTGKNIEITTTLKEWNEAQFERIIGAGGDESTGSAEVGTITTHPDVSGSLNSKYFLLYNANNAVKYYVWMNVNSAGVDPSVVGATGVEVDLATSANANAVASAIQAELDALAGFVATVSSNIVTYTNAVVGGTSDPADVNTGFTFAVTTQGLNAGLFGWGNSKDFSSMSEDSKSLVLHPIALANTDMSRDMIFWLAYPLPDSIVYSGENPQTVSVTWKIFPDCTRENSVRYFVRGSHL